MCHLVSFKVVLIKGEPQIILFGNTLDSHDDIRESFLSPDYEAVDCEWTSAGISVETNRYPLQTLVEDWLRDKFVSRQKFTKKLLYEVFLRRALPKNIGSILPIVVSDYGISAIADQAFAYTRSNISSAAEYYFNEIGKRTDEFRQQYYELYRWAGSDVTTTDERPIQGLVASELEKHTAEDSNRQLQLRIEIALNNLKKMLLFKKHGDHISMWHHCNIALICTEDALTRVTCLSDNSGSAMVTQYDLWNAMTGFVRSYSERCPKD